MRSRLRKQIRESWHRAISEDYSAQRINSERSLQASVWSRLNATLLSGTRRMFIEPSLVCNAEIRRPDIVICNTKAVIGIIELKYIPRGSPKWAKDIDTFRWVLDNRNDIFVSNTRYRGIAADARRYPLGEDVLFVWAGVHSRTGLTLKEYLPPGLSKSFLELHAETYHDGEVSIR